MRRHLRDVGKSNDTRPSISSPRPVRVGRHECVFPHETSGSPTTPVRRCRRANCMEERSVQRWTPAEESRMSRMRRRLRDVGMSIDARPSISSPRPVRVGSHECEDAHETSGCPTTPVRRCRRASPKLIKTSNRSGVAPCSRMLNAIHPHPSPTTETLACHGEAGLFSTLMCLLTTSWVSLRGGRAGDGRGESCCTRSTVSSVR